MSSNGPLTQRDYERKREEEFAAAAKAAAQKRTPVSPLPAEPANSDINPWVVAAAVLAIGILAVVLLLTGVIKP